MSRSRPNLMLIDQPAAPATLESVYRTHAAYVAGVVFKLLGRDHEIDDVVQDVFLAASRGLEKVREPAAIKGWLATIAVRFSIRRLRQRRLRSFLGLDAVTENEIAATPSGQEQRVLLARVYAVLDGLPARDRVAWTLQHVEGESLERVAQMCGCSLATVKRRIASAQRSIERVVS
jgi:RNA polymerase sigma-70 factor (ECF subfamily)